MTARPVPELVAEARRILAEHDPRGTTMTSTEPKVRLSVRHANENPNVDDVRTLRTVVEGPPITVPGYGSTSPARTFRPSRLTVEWRNGVLTSAVIDGVRLTNAGSEYAGKPHEQLYLLATDGNRRVIADWTPEWLRDLVEQYSPTPFTDTGLPATQRPEVRTLVEYLSQDGLDPAAEVGGVYVSVGGATPRELPLTVAALRQLAGLTS